jgi:hypothetical protein
VERHLENRLGRLLRGELRHQLTPTQAFAGRPVVGVLRP